LRVRNERRTQRVKLLRRFQIRLATSSFEKIPTAGQDISATSNRGFEFEKRGQLFLRMHNETLTVAVRVNNPDFPPFAIKS
jgi:hypothetical protein